MPSVRSTFTCRARYPVAAAIVLLVCLAVIVSLSVWMVRLVRRPFSRRQQLA